MLERGPKFATANAQLLAEPPTRRIVPDRRTSRHTELAQRHDYCLCDAPVSTKKMPALSCTRSARKSSSSTAMKNKRDQQDESEARRRDVRDRREVGHDRCKSAGCVMPNAPSATCAAAAATVMPQTSKQREGPDSSSARNRPSSSLSACAAKQPLRSEQRPPRRMAYLMKPVESRRVDSRDHERCGSVLVVHGQVPGSQCRAAEPNRNGDPMFLQDDGPVQCNVFGRCDLQEWSVLSGSKSGANADSLCTPQRRGAAAPG